MKTRWLLGMFALVVPPTIFALYVWGSYQLALAQGLLPLNFFPEWLWYVVFVICTLCGLASVLAIAPKKISKRLALSLVYIVVMTVVLLRIHLTIACSLGDCI